MLVQTWSSLLLSSRPQACGWTLGGTGCCDGSIAFTSWGGGGRGLDHEETQVTVPRKTTHCSVIVASLQAP